MNTVIKMVNVESEYIKSLIELANEKSIYIEIYEGNLLNNYVLYDTDNFEVSGQTATYIICKECYVNEWTSNYTIVMTNDINEVNEHTDIFNNFDE
ncbi:hypothetical protein MG295_00258 [Bacillus phage vB_BcgM]|nr:hypothetical protein MG295_00258 [Bacillus phage vB_BcgM]